MIIFRYAPIKLQNLGCRVGQKLCFPSVMTAPFSSEVRQGRQGMSLLIICGSMLSLACHPCVLYELRTVGWIQLFIQTTVIIMMIQYNHILYKLYIYVYYRFSYDNGHTMRYPASLDEPSCFNGKCMTSFWAEMLVVAKLLKKAGLGDDYAASTSAACRCVLWSASGSKRSSNMFKYVQIFPHDFVDVNHC